jgi:hypothetical protein
VVCAHALCPRLQVLKELHAACAPTDDGADIDSSQGTLQLEVYALEIQMYNETKNNKKLRVRQASAMTPELEPMGLTLVRIRKSTTNRFVFGQPSHIPAFKASSESVEARCTCQRVRFP